MLARPKLDFDKYSNYPRDISEVNKLDKEGAVSHCLKQKIIKGFRDEEHQKGSEVKIIKGVVGEEEVKVDERRFAVMP